MNISNWLLYDNNLDKYSLIEVSKLLKTFLAVIPLVASILAIVNFSLGFSNIGFTILTVPVFCLISFIALQRGMINLSIIILITVLIAANTLSCTLGNGVHETGIIVLPVIVLFSSLVLNVRGVVITTTAVILCLAYIVFGEMYGLYPTRAVPAVRWVDLVVVQAVTVIHIFVTYTFANITKKNLQRVKIELENQKKYKEEITNSLSEKTELLRLVHHRVKNNLLLINSLLELEAYGTDKSKSALTAITSNINTIARAHDPLYHTEDYKQVETKPYLEQVIATFAQSSSIEKIDHTIQDHLIFHQKALLLGVLIQQILHKIESTESKIVVIDLTLEGDQISVRFKLDREQTIERARFTLEDQLISKVRSGSITVEGASVRLTIGANKDT